MNNHQNAIFHQLDNFIKHSHSFAMTIFHKITNSAKLAILLIIPTYEKVSVNKADFSTHTYQQDFHVAPNPKKTIKLGAPSKKGGSKTPLISLHMERYFNTSMHFQ
jgi:hypothetical protein